MSAVACEHSTKELAKPDVPRELSSYPKPAGHRPTPKITLWETPAVDNTYTSPSCDNVALCPVIYRRVDGGVDGGGDSPTNSYLFSREKQERILEKDMLTTQMRFVERKAGRNKERESRKYKDTCGECGYSYSHICILRE
jgi:hypothetical protein